MEKTIKTVSICLLLFLATPVFAADIYVATNGRDASGNGSIDSPYRTLAYVLDHVIREGDRVIVRAGTYTTDIGFQIMYNDVTLMAYPGEHVHLHAPINIGADNKPKPPYATVYVAGKDHVTIKDLEITGGGRYTVSFGYFQGHAPHYGTVDNCEVHHCGTDCVKAQTGSDNFTLMNSYIHHSCEAAHSLYPDFAGMKKRDQNCQGLDIVQGDNLIVRGNHFADIRSRNAAIVPKGGGRNDLIENNLIERSFGGIVMGGNTGWSFMNYDDNPKGYQEINCIVRNNIIKDIKWIGLSIVQTDGCQVYNNTLINVGTLDENDDIYKYAPYTSLGQAHDGIGFAIKHYSNHGPHGPMMPPSRDIVFKNNVVMRDSGQIVDKYHHETVALQAILSKNGWHMPIEDGTFYADYNNYYDPNSPVLRYRADRGVDGSKLKTTMASWRVEKAFAGVANDKHSMYGDPRVDMKTGVPLSGSPLLGAGTAVPGLSTDFYGNPRDPNHIDIGAIQVTGVDARCDAQHLYICTSQNCDTAGGNWCNGVCQEQSCNNDGNTGGGSAPKAPRNFKIISK